MLDEDNDKDKINLTDLNKTRKSFTPTSLKNPFKKQTGPNRDEEGRFAATSGGGGLRTVKQFNWKRAAPLIIIVTLAGGFFVFQSFAATFKESRLLIIGGIKNCRDWGRVNGVRAEYYTRGAKSNVNQDFLNKEYHDAFGVFPTVLPWESSEVRGWLNRAEQLHDEYAKDTWRQKCGITWQVHKEIVVSTPKAREIRAADQSLKGSDVLETMYAEQMGLGSGMTRLRYNAYARIYASSRSNLPIMPIAPSKTEFAGKKKNGWPDKIKICAILYNRNRHDPANAKTIVRLTWNNSMQKSVTLETLPNLNAAEPVKYGADGYGSEPVDGYQGSANAIYVPMSKYEVCTDPVMLANGSSRNARSGRPIESNNYSASVGLSSYTQFGKKHELTWPDIPVFIEQWSVKKAE